MKQLQVLEITPYFNSQPHEEADRDSAAQVSEAAHFNSQPHEEADGRHVHRSPDVIYFNSQPHEEADRTRQRHR